MTLMPLALVAESVHFMAAALGKLRRIQTEQGGLPAEACRILDQVDAWFEQHGGDLDERES